MLLLPTVAPYPTQVEDLEGVVGLQTHGKDLERLVVDLVLVYRWPEMLPRFSLTNVLFFCSITPSAFIPSV